MAKSQAEIDDDNRYRNRFRDGGNDQPMSRHKKKVFNRATGEFQKPAVKLDAKKWWKKKLGVGSKAGEGALAPATSKEKAAKARKEADDG